MFCFVHCQCFFNNLIFCHGFLFCYFTRLLCLFTSFLYFHCLRGSFGLSLCQPKYLLSLAQTIFFFAKWFLGFHWCVLDPFLNHRLFLLLVVHWDIFQQLFCLLLQSFLLFSLLLGENLPYCSFEDCRFLPWLALIHGLAEHIAVHHQAVIIKISI